ncbi:aminoacyl-tRNA hydrolase [Streptomyces sp. JV176]|uniref:aminoacyl-tRNA hydrolase n=1 Tax=Streptomyces sp. JV176 TaxID=858630 RepID=UPI002E76A231|nr:aminoacyl-tRNA hydrolase [Streptomyces sp. JV176]MEE1797768.1 aminoacyl-tRNA hydrolase [Streptomyces sp. JV176]
MSSESNESAPAESPFRHESTARDEAPQYVLPLVVRIEKAAPPTRTDALETAARAVLTLLSDERALGEGEIEGEWAQAVRNWQDARIRKVVRRARGAEWRRACTLPGITVTGRGPLAQAPASDGAPVADGTPTPEAGASSSVAEVRVFPPVPLDGWPKELAKLQVSGTDLDDPAPPPPADPAHPVLWLSPDLDMSAGKAMAQAGHGAQLAWWELPETDRASWRDAGFPLSVRTADPAHWRQLTTAGLPVVRDAGFTEIAAGSCTVVADHPSLRR